jgi:ankyrin repeat protein
MLKNISSLFTQCMTIGLNSSITRPLRYTSEQENSYEVITSASFLSDKQIKNIEYLNYELHDAIEQDLGIEKITELLNKGANPNAWIPNYRTYPMRDAINSGNLEVVKLLLDYKANINGHSRCFETDDYINNLKRATMKGRYDIVELLLQEGADPNYIFISRYSDIALSQAIDDNNISIVELLIEYGAKIEGLYDDALLYRSKMSDIEDDAVMRLLLEKGVNPVYGINDRQPCFHAIDLDNPQALSLLLSYGTKDTFKNIIDKMMFKIVEHYSIKCMKVLLDYGYDINGYYLNDDNIRMTPLMMAVDNKAQYKIFSELQCMFITYLLDNGANIVNKKEQCYQPCFIAIQTYNSKALSLLLSRGAKDEFKNIIDQMMLKIVEHYSIMCLEVLLDYGYNINDYYLNDKNIRVTLLMMTLDKEDNSEENLDFIKFLLGKDADPNVKYEDSNDTTLIEKAMQSNRLDIAFQLRSYGVEADEDTIDKIINKYGIDPKDIIKSVRAPEATAQISFEDNIDYILMPPLLKKHFKERNIYTRYLLNRFY